MSDHVVTVNLPDAVFDRLREIAEATAQPVEEVLIQRVADSFADPDLGTLPPTEQAELAAFRFLSEPTLRSITREQMPRLRQDRMVELGDRNSRGLITPSELEEYRQLVEDGERLTLRKAWAANVLMSRGIKITGEDFTAQDE